MEALYDQALAHLRELTSQPDVRFRDGQYEAIRSVIGDRKRALVVQRTGWGKSAVYLIATRILRDRGAGPTVIVSPLLALMNNQLEMTERLGLCGRSVSSTNPEDWDSIFGEIRSGRVDLLLISPERLNNREFLQDVKPHLFSAIGMLVIDEVHCISDWGHDFRPDYRRLREIAAALPPNTPILGTTATANDRVVRDVREQLGDGLEVFRGTLERESLSLHVLNIPDRGCRLAWLADRIPHLPGSGIVYCLTVNDANTVGDWLRSKGIRAASYTGTTPNPERLDIERALSSGDLKVVVATSALAMGYDNPRIEFVIHYQSPGSAIAYYQQVGRAGRAVESSLGVLLTGSEDVDIQDWFIDTAFPSEADTSEVLRTLRESPGRSIKDLEAVVNLRRVRLEALLKILEVERAVYREGSNWFRSAAEWRYPAERITAVTAQRRAEQAAMRTYSRTDQCLMEFLRRQLDDPGAVPCGRCSNCAGRVFGSDVPAGLVAEALERQRRSHLPIRPRLQVPAGHGRGLDLRKRGVEEGRCLTRWGDPGLAELVKRGKYEQGRFSGELVDATRSMIEGWAPDPYPTWLTWVPSTRNGLVEDLARHLGAALQLPVIRSLQRVQPKRPQKEMQNSSQQAANVARAFEVVAVRAGPVFLVDDLVDSRWTLTVLGGILRMQGSGPVYPVALSDTSHRGE